MVQGGSNVLDMHSVNKFFKMPFAVDFDLKIMALDALELGTHSVLSLML